MRHPSTRPTVVVLRGDEEVACWPLRWVGAPGLALVDELARLQLSARRDGCSIVVRDVCPELGALLALTGIGPVLGVGDADGGWDDGDDDAA